MQPSTDKANKLRTFPASSNIHQEIAGKKPQYSEDEDGSEAVTHALRLSICEVKQFLNEKLVF